MVTSVVNGPFPVFLPLKSLGSFQAVVCEEFCSTPNMMNRQSLIVAAVPSSSTRGSAVHSLSMMGSRAISLQPACPFVDIAILRDRVYSSGLQSKPGVREDRQKSGRRVRPKKPVEAALCGGGHRADQPDGFALPQCE